MHIRSSKRDLKWVTNPSSHGLTRSWRNAIELWMFLLELTQEKQCASPCSTCETLSICPKLIGGERSPGEPFILFLDSFLLVFINVVLLSNWTLEALPSDVSALKHFDCIQLALHIETHTQTLYHRSVADTCPQRTVCVCSNELSWSGKRSQSATLLWTLSVAIKGDKSILSTTSQTASAAAERVMKMRRTLCRISCFVTLAVELSCISVTLGMYREGGSKASVSLTFKPILIPFYNYCIYFQNSGFLYLFSKVLCSIFVFVKVFKSKYYLFLYTSHLAKLIVQTRLDTWTHV